MQAKGGKIVKRGGLTRKKKKRRVVSRTTFAQRRFDGEEGKIEKETEKGKEGAS